MKSDVKPDKYFVRTLDEICFHLRKYKDREDDWEAIFYDLDEILLFSFENDEETIQRIQTEEETYEMVTEIMDIALMMGKEFNI